MVRGKLHVCGGHDGQKDLDAAECLDLDMGVWCALPPMLNERHGAAAASACGQLFVCGGASSLRPLKSAEVFIPTRAPGTWLPLPDMSEARAGASAAVVARKVYVCGGSGHRGHAVAKVERYDPVLREWDTVPQMLRARTNASAVTVAGQLYVCGGTVGAGNNRQITDVVEQLDPGAGSWATWERLPFMLEPRSCAAGASVWP